MKYEVIIIGGGLAALTAGIRLANEGRKVAIISAGQSALHFFSGSFDFLGYADNHHIMDPIAAIDSLDKNHPYRRLGKNRTVECLEQFPQLLAQAGITAEGSTRRNHYRITPFGYLKPTWLTLSDYARLDSDTEAPWKKVAIVNLSGYLDFYPRFLAYGLDRLGVDSHLNSIDLPQLSKLRKSTTEMRATNIARVMSDETLNELARVLNDLGKGKDAVFMPAVVDMYGESKVARLRSEVNLPLYFISTMPASVPGVRCQIMLRSHFEALGGTYLIGDTVNRAEIAGSRLEKIYTYNLDDMPLEADDFILATGSFFSYGLVATIDRVYEPIMGLDVHAPDSRTKWYDKNLYADQPYMTFGVKSDDGFHALRGGKPIDNLYVAGSIHGGINALKEMCGAGTTIATATHVADLVARNRK